MGPIIIGIPFSRINTKLKQLPHSAVNSSE